MDIIILLFSNIHKETSNYRPYEASSEKRVFDQTININTL